MKMKMPKKLIKILTISILFFIAAFSISYAWFQGFYAKNGTTITTGEIKSSFNVYTLNGSSLSVSAKEVSDASLTSFNSSILFTVDPNNSDNIIKNDAEIYIIVEKQTGSIDFDYYLYFGLEDPDNHVSGETGYSSVALEESTRYIGGFHYRLQKINSSITYNTSALQSLTNYATQSTLPQNLGEEENLSDITSKATTRGRLSGSDNYDYYRLTIGINNTAVLAQYSNKQIKIRTYLHTSQLDALSDQERGGNLITVSSETALDNALGSYLPGDTIKVIADISYTKDLVFSRPVNFKVYNSTLTVMGNMIFSNAYPDEYTIDTSEAGKIVIKKGSLGGGNLEVLAPNCKVEFIGKGLASQVGDFFVQYGIYINAGYTGDAGCYFNGVNFYYTDSSGGIPAAYAYYQRHNVSFLDYTKFIVESGTHLGIIEPIVNMQSLGSTPEVFYLINSGIIDQLSLASMNNNTAYTLIPQIMIDSYGEFIATDIYLPVWSTRFYTDGRSNNGNTRVIQEIGSSTLHISNSCTTFTDEDIEKDTSLEYVVDKSGDSLLGKDLIIHYYDLEGENNSLQSILQTYYTSISAEGTFNDNILKIKTLEIVSYYGKAITSADFTFIRTMNLLQKINLSNARTYDDSMPNLCLKGLLFLEECILPTTCTKICDHILDDTKVIYISVPTSVTIMYNYAFNRPIRYVNIENASTVLSIIPTLINRTSSIFCVPDNMINGYYSANTDDYYNRMIRPKGQVDDTGNYLYRIIDNNKYELLSIWDTDGLVNNSELLIDTIKINGVYQSISSIYDYSFYSKLNTTACANLKLKFGSGVKNIGKRAFRNNTNLKEVDMRDTTGLVIGANAFSECTNMITIGFTQSGGDIGEYAFYNCKNLSNSYGKPTGYVDGAGLTTLRERCFQDCDSIVIFKSSTIRNTYKYPFYTNDKLREVELLNLEHTTGISWSNNILKLAIGPVKEIEYRYLTAYSSVCYTTSFIYDCTQTDGWFTAGGGYSSYTVPSRNRIDFGNNSYDWYHVLYGDTQSYDILYNTLKIYSPVFGNGTIEGTKFSDYFTYGSNYNETYYDSGLFLCVLVDDGNGGKGVHIVCCYDKEVSTALVIPDTILYNGINYPVISIGENAFSSCKFIAGSSLTFGSNIKTIGAKAFSNEYYYSKVIDQVIFNGNVSIGNYAFDRCTIGTTTLNGTSYIGQYVFRNCTLDNFTISSTAVVTTDQYAFQNAKFQNLTFNGEVTTSYRSFVSIKVTNEFEINKFCYFYGTEVFRSGNFNNIDVNAEWNGSSTNFLTSTITNISFENVEYLGNNDPYEFYSCTFTNFSSTTLSGIKTIGSGEFYGSTLGTTDFDLVLNDCVELKAEVFRDTKHIKSISSTSINAIGSCCFYSCAALKEVNVPACQYLNGGSQFASCSNLVRITLGNVISWGNDFATNCKNLCDVYVCGFQGTIHQDTSITKTKGRFRGSGDNCIKIYCSDSMYSYLTDIRFDERSYAIRTGDVDPKDLFQIGTNEINGIDVGEYVCANGAIDATKVRVYGWNITSITGTDDVVIKNRIGDTNGVGGRVVESYPAQTLAPIVIDTTGDIIIQTGITSLSDEFCLYNGRHKKVYDELILNDVTTIGSYAFCQNNMTKITGNSVISIGYQAFYNCDILKSVYFENLKELYGQVFYSCDKLVYAYLPSFWKDTGSGHNFAYCAELTEVYIGPVYYTYGRNFYYCHKLRNLFICGHPTAGYHDTNAVYYGGVWGMYDSNKTSNFNKLRVFVAQDLYSSPCFTYISSDCAIIVTGNNDPKDLVSVNDTTYEGISIKGDVYAIDNSNPLNLKAYLASLNYPTITGTNYTLPSTVTIGSNTYNIVEYYQNAFRYTNIDLTGCLTMPSTLTKIGAYCFRNLKFATFSAPNVIDIGDQAFYNNTRLTSVYLPSCTHIGSYAFSNCTSLTSVSLEGIYTIDSYAFGCDSNVMPISTIILGENFTDWGWRSFKIRYTGGTNIYLKNTHSVVTTSYYALEESSTWNKCHLYVSTLVLSQYMALSDGWNGIGSSRMHTFDSQTTVGGLTYYFNTISNSNTNELTITSVTGTISDGQLVVPTTLNFGTTPLPVCMIYENALSNIVGNINTIYLPYTFKYFNNLDGACLSTLSSYQIIPDGIHQSKFTTVDGVLYSSDYKTLISYPRAKVGTEYTIPATTEIVASSAFYKANLLTKIIVANATTPISFLTKAVNGCTALTEIEFGRECHVYENTFYQCSSLTELDFDTQFPTTGGTVNDLIMFIAYANSFTDNLNLKVYVPDGTYMVGSESVKYLIKYQEKNIYSTGVYERLVER